MKRALATFVLAGGAMALQGCVAAVIPLAAAGAMTRSAHRDGAGEDSIGDGEEMAEQFDAAPASAVTTTSPSLAVAMPEVPQGASDAELLPETEEALRRFDLAPGLEAVPVAELAAPTRTTAAPAMADQATYAAFSQYALKVAALDPLKDDVRQSALLARPGVLVPERAPCNFVGNAVLIDLDPAGGLLDTARPADHAALAGALAELRGQEIEVIWSTALTADRAGDVRSWLKRSGLDPEGKDRLLLLRYPEDRKQTRREEASSERCLIAMLGDERSDFDELFDYLKKPDAAVGLDAMLGEGWFLAPVSDIAAAASPEPTMTYEGPDQ